MARRPQALLILLVGAAAACGDADIGIESVQLTAETSDSWGPRGFVKMTGALRNPTSLDGTDTVDVWLRIPPGTVIDVAAGDRPHLALPTGTIIDRVESVAIASGAQRVDDVRGTEILAEGKQRFHVMRRGDNALEGFAWPRGDAHAQARVDDRLTAWLGTHSAKPRQVKRLVDLNQCARCHREGKPESALESERGLPNRPTDAHGFYQVEGVLADEAPVETSRPRDPNLDDPFVAYRCVAGSAPERVETEGVARMRCADGTPVLGRLDIAASLAATSPHAIAVCATRAALHERMTAAARNAFGEAFAVCGITKASVQGAGSP